jgi:hypothetical protein
MDKANAGGWKTCSRGHKYRGPGPCPICYPGGAKKRKTGLFAIRGLLALVLLVFCGAAGAQSGRAVLHGWVNFEGVAYVDKQPTATVRVVPEAKGASPYEAQTDEHGFYDLTVVSLGRFHVEISAPGFQTYATDLYLSSDVVANLPIQLRATPAKPE